MVPGDIDEECDLLFTDTSSHRSEADFHINQLVLLLQQSGWLGRCTSSDVKQIPCVDITGVLDDIPDVSIHLKKWKDEIKQQESVIAIAHRNALNPDEQCTFVTACQTETSSAGIAFTSIQSAKKFWVLHLVCPAHLQKHHLLYPKTLVRNQQTM
jgi:hypothetical protein